MPTSRFLCKTKKHVLLSEYNISGFTRKSKLWAPIFRDKELHHRKTKDQMKKNVHMDKNS